MKTLSINQPWAWAIAEGHKVVENRSWSTRYRGPIAIHAGKNVKWMPEGSAFIESQGLSLPADLIFGAVIATAELVDVIHIDEAAGLFDHAHNVQDDPWAFGPYCWVLANAKKLESPVYCPGRLQLFETDLSQV